jgi:hypothetical protein
MKNKILIAAIFLSTLFSCQETKQKTAEASPDLEAIAERAYL